MKRICELSHSLADLHDIKLKASWNLKSINDLVDIILENKEVEGHCYLLETYEVFSASGGFVIVNRGGELVGHYDLKGVLKERYFLKFIKLFVDISRSDKEEYFKRFRLSSHSEQNFDCSLIAQALERGDKEIGKYGILEVLRALDRAHMVELIDYVENSFNKDSSQSKDSLGYYLKMLNLQRLRSIQRSFNKNYFYFIETEEIEHRSFREITLVFYSLYTDTCTEFVTLFLPKKSNIYPYLMEILFERANFSFDMDLYIKIQDLELDDNEIYKLVEHARSIDVLEDMGHKGYFDQYCSDFDASQVYRDYKDKKAA